MISMKCSVRIKYKKGLQIFHGGGESVSRGVYSGCARCAVHTYVNYINRNKHFEIVKITSYEKIIVLQVINNQNMSKISREISQKNPILNCTYCTPCSY